MVYVFLLSLSDPENQLLLKTFNDRTEALLYYSAVSKFAMKLGCMITIKEENK